MHAVLGADVLNDLEFFLSYTHTEDGTLIAALSGDVYGEGAIDRLRQRLRTPTTDVNLLGAYQSRILRLRELLDTVPEVLAAHREVREHLQYAEWMRSQAKEIEGVDPMEVVFFKFRAFKALGMNRSPLLLTSLNIYNVAISPTLGLMSPVIYFLIPYGILVRKFGLRFSFKEFLHVLWKALVMMLQQSRTVAGVQLSSMALSLVMYGQGVLNAGMLARDAWKVNALLHKQMCGLFAYLRAGLRLVSLCENSDTHRLATESLRGVQYDCHRLNIGSRLRTYEELRKSSESAYPLDAFETVVDELLCDMGVALLTKGWCVARFEEGPRAHLQIEGGRHPVIQDGVPNDVRLYHRNCVITGPNAAGKSTLIKGVACNVILAQTLGFACAASYVCTPFMWISTQINIPDCKGVESLFQAEMHRCKTNIEQVRSLSEGQHALLVFDEIFNSTNVVEGVAAAYAILDTLGERSNCTTIITTHYPYLCKLPNFDRYKMNAQLDEQMRVERFPYRLTKGVSNQYIALEMLRENFDPVIVDRAITVKNQLLDTKRGRNKFKRKKF